MPRLATSYSLDNFAIVEEDFIYGNVFSSTPTNTSNTNASFDGDLKNGFVSSGSCHFGMEFKEDHVGSVSEVRYFMSKFTLATFSGKLIFLGCTKANSLCVPNDW